MSIAGANIRRLRKARGMTLEVLAEKIGTDSGNLSRVERGLQWLDDSRLRSVAAALGVPVSHLFDEPRLVYMSDIMAAYQKAPKNIRRAILVLLELPSEDAS